MRIILSILLLSVCYPTVINVPADLSTIQAGINEAKEGDTVLVAAGTYDERIKAALVSLAQNAGQYLTPKALRIYSPKFLTMLGNLQDDKNSGLHLIYSQFRTLEGIGILRLVLLANGFGEFRIDRDEKGNWRVVTPTGEDGLDRKPMFALYTGTEDAKTKELIRRIYSDQWEGLPKTLLEDLERIADTNKRGQIIKVLMITSSGAEGINLRNVRFVHIMEPYWHPVRIEQVIGRARRICSHQDLPKDERKVEVFIYLMRFTEHQVAELISSELKIKDISKLDRQTPMTSDQALYEISMIKENINKQILKAIKEASIDCALQVRTGGNNLTCFAFTDASPEAFAYKPSLTGGDDDDVAAANRRERKVKIRTFNHGGKKYAYNPKDNEVYDFESYQITKTQKGAKPIVVGKIVEKDGAKNVEFL